MCDSCLLIDRPTLHGLHVCALCGNSVTRGTDTSAGTHTAWYRDIHHRINVVLKAPIQSDNDSYYCEISTAAVAKRPSGQFQN